MVLWCFNIKPHTGDVFIYVCGFDIIVNLFFIFPMLIYAAKLNEKFIEYRGLFG